MHPFPGKATEPDRISRQPPSRFMISVAHVGSYKPESANGVHKTIVGLLDALSESDVSVELWHPTSKVQSPVERRLGALRIWELPVYRSRLRNALGLPTATMSFVRKLARNVDLVHLHSVFIPENVWLARLGVPCVITPNGGYDNAVMGGRNRLLKLFWTQWQERDFVRRAAMIHAVSPREEAQLRRIWGHPNVCFIPNGINLTAVPSPRKPPSACSNWSFLGRLSIEQKGLDLLLTAFAAAFPADTGASPPLVLAGPDFREGKQRVAWLANQLKLTPQPEFRGPLFGQDKWQFLDDTRLFLHTSRWEGMPFALIEAMAMGRPVLVTRETNLAEWVERYHAGWVVNTDPEAIARGLKAACEASSEVLDAMGGHSRKLVETHFDWRSIAPRMAVEYANVVNANRTRHP